MKLKARKRGAFLLPRAGEGERPTYGWSPENLFAVAPVIVADVRAVAHIKIDLAPEVEIAVDDGMRPDHDARVLVLAPRPAGRFLDEDAALDA